MKREKAIVLSLFYGGKEHGGYYGDFSSVKRTVHKNE